MATVEYKKVVVVGPPKAGMGSFVWVLNGNKFEDNPNIVVFDHHGGVNADFEDKSYSLQIWETAGGEDYDRLRPLSYPGTDAFALIFDVTERHLVIDVFIVTDDCTNIGINKLLFFIFGIRLAL